MAADEPTLTTSLSPPGPQLTGGLALRGAPPVGLCKRAMTRVHHHCGLSENSAAALTPSVLCPCILPPPHIPWQPAAVFALCPCFCLFQEVLLSEPHVGGLFRLAPFTE